MAHTPQPYLIKTARDVRVLPHVRRPVEKRLSESFPDLLDLAEWRKPCPPRKGVVATLATRGKLDAFAGFRGSAKRFVAWREALKTPGQNYAYLKCPHGHHSIVKLSARPKH